MSDATHGFSTENFLAQLPRVISEDANLKALAHAVALALTAHLNELSMEGIYTRISALPDALLDILASDFKIDWWNPNGTHNEKVSTILCNWTVHRHLGTRAAVSEAVSAVFPDTRVLEWFEYGGEPYHFKLQIDSAYSDMDQENHRRLMRSIEMYKNVRSHLDAVEFYDIRASAAAVTGAYAVGMSVSEHAEAVMYQ